MALPKRQMQGYMTSDDQNPDSAITYKGKWRHRTDNSGNWFNNTYSRTSTPGSSFSFTFSGSQAILFGGVTNLTDVGNWPTANYMVDGIHGGSQMPYLDIDHIAVVYFETTVLANRTHTIDVNVTVTNVKNPYIIDYFLYLPLPGTVDSGVETTRMAPSSTSTPASTTITQSMPIGGIVGGIVGGIAGIAVLSFVAYYFLIRRPRDHRAEMPGADNFRAGDDRVEPFYATMASPTAPRLSPTTEKGAQVSQQSWNVQQPPRPRDYEIRFNENGEGESRPSRPPTSGPPTYSLD